MALFDGTTNIDALTNGHVQPRDLSQPLSLGRKFDWVMSLEVGEHIPRQFEHTFISNIVNHATTGIVLSWAVVGQRGTGHINTRSNAHIASGARTRGLGEGRAGEPSGAGRRDDGVVQGVARGVPS